MRVSRLMLNTLRDVPAEADIISHQLLVRGGYIKRLTGGIYAYMPLPVSYTHLTLPTIYSV